jgi:hypothetical protein
MFKHASVLADRMLGKHVYDGRGPAAAQEQVQ